MSVDAHRASVHRKESVVRRDSVKKPEEEVGFVYLNSLI